MRVAAAAPGGRVPEPEPPDPVRRLWSPDGRYVCEHDPRLGTWADGPSVRFSQWATAEVMRVKTAAGEVLAEAPDLIPRGCRRDWSFESDDTLLARDWAPSASGGLRVCVEWRLDLLRRTFEQVGSPHRMPLAGLNAALGRCPAEDSSQYLPLRACSHPAASQRSVGAIGIFVFGIALIVLTAFDPKWTPGDALTLLGLAFLLLLSIRLFRRGGAERSPSAVA